MLSIKHNITLILLIAISFSGLSQNGTVEGVVLDKEMNDGPLPFANVLVKGTATGTVTDFDGKFSLNNLEPGTYSFVFSFVGYETITLENIVVEADKFTQLSVSLGPGANALARQSI